MSARGARAPSAKLMDVARRVPIDWSLTREVGAAMDRTAASVINHLQELEALGLIETRHEISAEGTLLRYWWRRAVQFR